MFSVASACIDAVVSASAAAKENHLHASETPCWPFKGHCRRAIHKVWSVGGAHWENMHAAWPHNLDLVNQRLLTSSPVLGRYVLLNVTTLRAISGKHFWESKALLRSSGWYMLLNPVKAPLYKLLRILTGMCRDLLICGLPQALHITWLVY